jgi:anti-sigma regulatory factor (Ser/Thr protein kinase)
MTNEVYERILAEANRQIAKYHKVATDYGPSNTDPHQTYAMGQEDGAHAILFIIKQVMKKAAGPHAND